MALTPEQVAAYDVGSGIGMKKLDELTQMGATRQQILDIARRAPVVGGRLQEIFPELSQQAVTANLPPLRGTAAGDSSIDPTIRPYLEMGLQRAEQLFFGPPPQFFPGQTYVSPSEQTLAALQQQEALARQAQPALEAGQQAFLGGLSGLQQTAGGAFLGGSPGQQAAIEAATRPIQQQFEQVTLPGVSSQFSRAGRYGSGAMERAIGTATEATGRALGDVASSIAYQDYANERARQQAAQGALIQGATLAPQIYGQQFLPSQQLGQVGAAREQIAGMPLQEQMQRFQFEQQAPIQQLQSYLSSVYGSPMGGSNVVQPQVQTNRISQGIGGATLGYLAGDAFGFSPGMGAAIGGGLGLLF